MNLSLTMLPLVFAAVDWIAVARNWKRLRYVAKPLVVVTLLVLLWIFTSFQGSMILFALALVFSMAGDISLILPVEQFKAALVFFLLAHISYIAVYTPSSTPSSFSLALLIMFGLVALALLIFNRITQGLTQTGNSRLKMPILLYMLALIWMVFSALTTLLAPTWTQFSALWTSAGGLLFLYSDSTLAWNRFVKPLPHGRLKVIISYHLAQIALIIGAILHYQSVSPYVT